MSILHAIYIKTNIRISGEICIVHGSIYAVLPNNIIAYMCSKTQLDCKPAAYMQPAMQKHGIYAINQSGVVPIGTCSVPCQTKSHSPVAL